MSNIKTLYLILTDRDDKFELFISKTAFPPPTIPIRNCYKKYILMEIKGETYEICQQIIFNCLDELKTQQSIKVLNSEMNDVYIRDPIIEKRKKPEYLWKKSEYLILRTQDDYYSLMFVSEMFPTAQYEETYKKIILFAGDNHEEIIEDLKKRLSKEEIIECCPTYYNEEYVSKSGKVPK